MTKKLNSLSREFVWAYYRNQSSEQQHAIRKAMGDDLEDFGDSKVNPSKSKSREEALTPQS